MTFLNSLIYDTFDYIFSLIYSNRAYIYILSNIGVLNWPYTFRFCTYESLKVHLKNFYDGIRIYNIRFVFYYIKVAFSI